MNERIVIYSPSICSRAAELLAATIRPTCPTAEIVSREIPPGFGAEFLKTLEIRPEDLSFVACDEEHLPNVRRFVNHLRRSQPKSPVLVAYDGEQGLVRSGWNGISGVFSTSLSGECIRKLVQDHL